MEESSAEGGLSDRTERPPEEAKALRTAVLVVGYVLLVPSMILLVLAALEILANSSVSGSEDVRTYLWVSYVTGALDMAVALVIGFLMVRVGRKRLFYTVSDILYPSLVIVGAYMLLIAAVRILSRTLYTTLVVGWNPGMAILSMYQVPFIAGGLLLILIGRRKFLLEA